LGVLAIIIFFGLNFIVVRYAIHPLIAKLTFPKVYVTTYLKKGGYNLIQVKFVRFKKTPFYPKKKFNFFTNRIYFFRITAFNEKLRKENVFWVITQKPFKFISKQDIQIYPDGASL